MNGLGGPGDPATKGEQLAVALAALGVAGGLQRVYRVKRWKVPTPVWLAVTAGLTYAGWRAYKAWGRTA